MKLALSALLLSATQAQQILSEAKNDKCYVLALSSGDENAVYQVGALAGLLQHYGSSEVAYDAISGIGGGAINAVMLSNFEKGQEQAAFDRMLQFWKDASNTKLYKDWIGGVTRGLFFEGGIYNSAPLEDFLKSQFTKADFKRMLDIGITKVEDGDYVDYTDKNLDDKSLPEALYASMSTAGFFPPADVLGGHYFDGSAVYDLDIFKAVNRCKETHQEKDIVVDVVMTSAANLKDVSAEDFKSLQMLMRFLEIASYYNSMDGYLRAKFAYKDVNFRHLIMPTGPIGSSIKPLNQDEAWMQKVYDLGV